MTTCIRVYDAVSACLAMSTPSCHNILHTLSRSMGYMTECSYSISATDLTSYPLDAPSYRNPCKCTSRHIRCQREVRWKGLITAHPVSVLVSPQLHYQKQLTRILPARFAVSCDRQLPFPAPTGQESRPLSLSRSPPRTYSFKKKPSFTSKRAFLCADSKQSSK